VHIDPFDHYQARESSIHELDARVKILFTVAFIVSNTLLPDGAWISFALAFLGVIAISRLAKLPDDYAPKRSLLALPFALVAITTLFTQPGQVILPLSLGPWNLTITDASLVRFLSIVTRSLLSVQMAILLTATTPFPDLIHALRHLRLPQTLVAIISFMYRYLFILADEAIRLLRARTARSAGKQGVRGVRWQAKIAGHMAGQLFVRSFERSDRVYNAMLARGYTGHLYTLRPHQMQRRDWMAGLAGVSFLAILQLLAHISLI